MLFILHGALAVQDSPVTITMWHIAAESDPFHPVLQKAIDRFNATHSDVQFEEQIVPNDSYQDQLRIAMMSGQPPDVFQTRGGRRVVFA